MKWLIVFIIGVLILQIALFFVVRRIKKRNKENSVIEKYNIRSASDAFRLIQDPDVPSEDKQEIERLYKGND
ncbi:MAG: hypothetical protein R3345_05590 [Fulvivirga sp.]|nr:hypothetical protein [Fulvivirga sp.]